MTFEEVERCYRQSPYVKEICVMGLAREDEPTTKQLFAVVVPNMELVRERRIVNVGDLLRFELEGQSVHLPPHERVLGYELWFEPLPRMATGTLKRHEIEERLRQKQQERARTAAAGLPPPEWADDPHAQATVVILTRRAKGGTVTPAANLELDLGLDSIGRIELITELEQRFGVRIPEDKAPQIFTVAQLIEAARPGAEAVEGSSDEDSWAVLLRDLPPATLRLAGARSGQADPLLSGLLERRPLMSAMFFLLARLIRLMMPRVVVSGFEHLPPNGPYIISPNHQGYLDPFILCGVLPFRLFKQLFFVGASEYFETAITRWLARQANLIPVDPDANLVPAMKAGAFGLRHGKILLLFPEGERSIDGTVKHFKKGASVLACRLGVPIVPVAIKGSFEIWPRGRGINWALFLPWSKHRIQIAIGPPLWIDGSSDYAAAASGLRERVVEAWKGLA